MFDLADSKRYLDAGNIDEAILKYMTKRHEDYETNLRYLGIWLSKTDQKKRALLALERYMKEYKDGYYIDEVEKVRDELFIATKEKDTKKLMQKYDALIQTYKNAPIGQKALYEKVKLMLSKKMYSDILHIKESILALDSTLIPR